MTYALLLICVWIMFVVINIVLADWNNEIRLHAIQQKKLIAIRHGWWSLFYMALVAVPYLFFKDWYLVGSLILLRLAVFSLAYNIAAGLPAFFLSKTTTSLTDRFLLAIGLKTAEWVNIVAMAGSIFLLIKSITHE